MNINITPNPTQCANQPGGVNSVVFDHAVGFLAAGCEINGKDGIRVTHALAQDDRVDVFHCHGLYPIGGGMFDNSFSRANDIILKNALQAKVTVCISEFSANLLRHRLHIDPLVTRNGIWTRDYHAAGSPSGAVIFPKANIDANARPDDVKFLKANSDFPLLSIAKIEGVKSTGKLTRPDFIKTLSSCSVYLGTTKENNSMATMEAMVMGIPVVGYDIGFNSEWLVNGVGCELVQNGDRRGLVDAITKVRSDWYRYSRVAREYAAIFDWQPVIDELLGIYERVGKAQEEKTVSVIIPCHNYAAYLPEAIQSVLAQTVPCEVIVVDDKSTDDSAKIAKSFQGVKVLENAKNLGVAETRNRGIEAASGKYIVCLDADDRLRPDFVAKHLAAFRTGDHAIAYAPIELMDTDGKRQNRFMFRSPARTELQTRGQNQIPSCCMFKKEYWRRAGGYDRRYTPAEDANLWLKIFVLGGVPVKASDSPLMDYRTHNKSLSAAGVFPNWYAEYKPLVNAPIVERDPEITFIIEGNERIKDTLWSLENQEVKNWSCQLKTPNGLRESFPWLNKQTSRRGSVIRIQAGTVLLPDCLTRFKAQPPAWITAPKFPLP
jgi:glycosyltransferase involved in cell wall biosynthesis